MNRTRQVRTTLYHDPDILDQVRKIAHRMKRSLTAQIDLILEEYINEFKKQK